MLAWMLVKDFKMSSKFVHLHTHTQYSLLDGAIRISNLMIRSKELGFESVAITDHGNMFGAIYFYQAAKKLGINPIIGCEVYVAPGDHRVKDTHLNKRIAYHLVLLSKDLTGYKNLVRLVSIAFLEGFYYKPRIDLTLLCEYHEGLIALSACLHGKVASKLLDNRMDQAEQAALELASIMGEGSFFLELQDAGLANQKLINPGLIEIGQRLGLGLVATNDCHFLKREDHQAHDALLCIQTGKSVNDLNRMRIPIDLYYKSPQEMDLLLGYAPGALANTVDIARSCRLDLPLGKRRSPRFLLKKEDTIECRLRLEAYWGLHRRYAEEKQRGNIVNYSLYKQRLIYELDVIIEIGFSDYFLVVADFINWAKNKNIPVGPGRGSVAGSLVAWSLRITELDPIRYGLIFERFLNKARVSMPDIDVDFCYNRRPEVLEYVNGKYGHSRVAQIITFGSMQARAVVRDVGRVMDIPYNEVDQIAKLVPFFINVNLKEIVESDLKLRERMQADARIKKLVKTACALEGLSRHASIHAAGVVIADKSLSELVPMYKGPNDEIVTQFDMKSIEETGFIKFDFLGLRTLTILDLVVRMVCKYHNPNFSINLIPMDDDKTYKLLASGDTSGVFQFESYGMKELLSKMCPERFEDVIALVALYRPGPLESGMVDDFIARKHGEKEVVYLLPQLASILKETYGVIVYQEQVMEIARVLAGYSLAEGDILRRAMGKKNSEEMANQRSRFIQGAIINGVDPKKTKQIFELMEKFAGYGFNKSHSAAYALIAYQSAYLKAHFPLEFMAALLTNETNNTDMMIKYIGECRDRKLLMLPPDINKSDSHFSVANKGIRFGLAAVKNVGEGAIESILAARAKNGPYKGLYDLCERVDLRKVNRRVLESLIKCGAFDSTGVHRAQLIALLDRAIEHGQTFFRDRLEGQVNMFIAYDTKFYTSIDCNFVLSNPVSPWSEDEFLTYEKKTLGFYITSHPLVRFKEEIKIATQFDTIDVYRLDDQMSVQLVGLPTDIKEKITRKGERMAFMRLEDLKGSLEVIIFPNCYNDSSRYLNVGSPVLISGNVDKDERGCKIKATKIVPLIHQVQTKVVGNNVILNLEVAGLTRKRLRTLKQILQHFCGDYQVVLRFNNISNFGNTVLTLPNQYKVNPFSRLKEQINELFGYKVIESN